MPTFILAAKRFVKADGIMADPKVMLESNELTAYTQRANGTERHLELAPVGSTRRETCEWVSERLFDGATVAQVARELHVSVPTVRRYLLALEITEAIEAGEYDDVWAEANGFAVAADQDDAPVVCTPESDCAVHGDGGSVAADQPCPMDEPTKITVIL